MKVDHELYNGLGQGFGDLVEIFAGGSERLFDDNMLAGTGRGDDGLAVRESGGGDGDGIDIGIAQHLAVICVDAACTPPVPALRARASSTSQTAASEAR